jgi:hypothetical protein
MSKNQNDTFTTDYFSINPHGIDILRNGYKCKHLEYNEIKLIEIKKSRSIKKWYIASVLGIVISFFFLRLIIIKTPQFNLSEVVYVRSALLVYISLYILFFAGLFLIIISNIRTLVINIVLHNKQKYLYPLTTLKKNQQLIPFINFLSARVNTEVSLPKIVDA